MDTSKMMPTGFEELTQAECVMVATLRHSEIIVGRLHEYRRLIKALRVVLRDAAISSSDDVMDMAAAAMMKISTLQAELDALKSAPAPAPKNGRRRGARRLKATAAAAPAAAPDAAASVVD